MVVWYKSITTKLTAAFIILILVIAGLSVMYTFGATKNALKETTRDELTALASVIATQIDGDVLTDLKPGDEESRSFMEVRDQLYTIQQASPEILFLYTMRETEEGIAFIVDAEYGLSDDAPGIDEVYDTPTDEMSLGFSGPVAEQEYTTDQWGTVISGYAPITDSSGDVVAILGVDMSADKVIERQAFIGNIIYIIMLVGIGFTAIIIGVLSRTMIRDIKLLNESAEKISTGDVNVQVSVDRSDEIGELAQSFSRMVSSLKIMMLEDKL